MQGAKGFEHHYERSCCPIANVLDLLGDKWTLLVIRDLFLGKTRFSEFADSREDLPSNILASRLKRLEYSGIIDKEIYCRKPARYKYTLTQKGLDLLPMLDAMEIWAKQYVPGVQCFPRFAPREPLKIKTRVQ